MNLPLINLGEIDKNLGDNFWSPVKVAEMNGWILYEAAIKGEFHWHKHTDFDEWFLVYRGNAVIRTKKGAYRLSEGESTVVPKGTIHRTEAEERAVILFLEPANADPHGN